jgi:hypothetical protein
MSCSHVLASSPAPSLADVVEWLDGSQQPAAWRRVGTLWKWVQFTGAGICNNLDAALAILDPELAAPFAGMDALPIAPYDLRYLGAPISKFSGRVGRWEAGTIRNMGVSQDVPFEGLGNAAFKMCGLIESQVRNGAGDSGGIVVVNDGPIAIHIAGDAADLAWSIPLQRAFDEWGLEMLSYQ